MRTAKLLSGIVAASALLSPCWAQQSNRAEPSTKSALTVESIEQRLGPFTIAGQSFTLMLQNNRVAGAPAGTLGQTLAKLEVRDQSGAVLYQKAFAHQLEGNKFYEVVTASARLLAGDNLTGLLVTYTHQPAQPGTEQSWQVFGFRNGKFALFDQPGAEPAVNGSAQFTGVLMRAPNGGAPMVVRGPLDTVQLRVWTGNFYVIVPLRVDWRSGKLMVGERCLESGGGPGLHETGCDMRVEAERVPSNAEFNFARVFPTPEEGPGGSVQHAVIAKGADVQLLKARSIVTWIGDGDVMHIQFANLWLKVLIDNNTDNEGWIHGEQDLAAVGLPARSPVQ